MHIRLLCRIVRKEKRERPTFREMRFPPLLSCWTLFPFVLWCFPLRCISIVECSFGEFTCDRLVPVWCHSLLSVVNFFLGGFFIFMSLQPILLPLYLQFGVSLLVKTCEDAPSQQSSFLSSTAFSSHHPLVFPSLFSFLCCWYIPSLSLPSTTVEWRVFMPSFFLLSSLSSHPRITPSSSSSSSFSSMYFSSITSIFSTKIASLILHKFLHLFFVYL